MQIEPDFLNDKDIARKLNLSTSWVRGQRHRRKKGLPHFLTIDAKYIGTCPRYLRGEIEAFVASIAA